MEAKLSGGSPIVQVAGEIDHWRAPELEQKINDLIDQGHNKLIVDFTDLTYIDSGGVSVLFLELQRLRPLRGKLVVVTRNKNIIKILSLVKMTKQECFSLCPDLEAARQQVKS